MFMSKYLFFNSLKGFGGLEMQTLLRAKDATDLGHESIAVVMKNTRAENFAKELNLPIEYINIKFSYIDIFAAVRLGLIIKKQKTDIIIVGKTELLSIAIAARNILYPKAKVILYQQMQSGLDKKDFFHNWIYSNLDGAIVINNLMRAQLVETTVFPYEKIEIAPCGVRLSKFSPEKFDKKELRHHFSLPEDSFIFGSVARIEENKGQMEILKAFIKLDSDNSCLVFCGNADDLNYLESLKKLTIEHNIQNRVFFFDFMKEIEKLMNTFDSFVLGTHCETYGLVIIEAMASNVPVIASNCGGVPEIITNGKNGLLFEARDIDGLSRQMKKLSDKSELNKQIVSNALSDIKKYEYNYQRDRFFNFCNQIAN
ncbi:MAG: D-inositol-3-phosphate glycosyltransferase [Bacteroidota bacterium]|nr:D-inositol-3-phosphate glycosyltransferase [Bacteroidota bacterium]